MFLCIFQVFVFKAQVVPEYNTYNYVLDKDHCSRIPHPRGRIFGQILTIIRITYGGFVVKVELVGVHGDSSCVHSFFVTATILEETPHNR